MGSIIHIQRISSIILYISNITGSTILLLILGHYLLGLTYKLKELTVNTNESASGDNREILPVYNNYPSYSKYWKEHTKSTSTHFEPYFHWKRNTFHGASINISINGIRSTTPPKSHNNKTIFIFGGSTMWGTGSKDSHTIPSFLQQELNNSNYNYKVTNFGETGFVSTQELNLLLLQLAQGNIPDIVIFYDGVNDGYAGAYSPAIPRDVQNLRSKFNKERKKNTFIQLYETSNYKRLINHFVKNNDWENQILKSIDSNSNSTIRLYLEHIKQVKAIGKEYGFKSLFFWQPNLLSDSKKLLPYEKIIINKSSQSFIKSQKKVYLDAKSVFLKREEDNIFFLGDIFEDTNEPIYIDWCHIGPDGNKIIARKIYKEIINEITQPFF